MGVMNWLFGTGDSVEDRDGNKHKVVRFESEGYVTVRNEKGLLKTLFGSTLTPASDDKSEEKRGGLDW